MKFLKYLLPCLLIISSCSALKSGSSSSQIGAEQWKLIAMNKQPFSGDNAYINFNEGDHRISGKAACNTFSSGYEMTRSTLKFQPIISTKMMCNGLMEQETQILAALQKVNRYEIRYGLLYMFDSNELLLTFKK